MLPHISDKPRSWSGSHHLRGSSNTCCGAHTPDNDRSLDQHRPHSQPRARTARNTGSMQEPLWRTAYTVSLCADQGDQGAPAVHYNDRSFFSLWLRHLPELRIANNKLLEARLYEQIPSFVSKVRRAFDPHIVSLGRFLSVFRSLMDFSCQSRRSHRCRSRPKPNAWPGLAQLPAGTVRVGPHLLKEKNPIRPTKSTVLTHNSRPWS